MRWATFAIYMSSACAIPSPSILSLHPVPLLPRRPLPLPFVLLLSRLALESPSVSPADTTFCPSVKTQSHPHDVKAYSRTNSKCQYSNCRCGPSVIVIQLLVVVALLVCLHRPHSLPTAHLKERLWCSFVGHLLSPCLLRLDCFTDTFYSHPRIITHLPPHIP